MHVQYLLFYDTSRPRLLVRQRHDSVGPFFARPLNRRQRVFFVNLVRRRMGNIIYSGTYCVNATSKTPRPIISFNPIFRHSHRLRRRVVNRFIFLRNTNYDRLLYGRDQARRTNTKRVPIFSRGTLMLGNPRRYYFRRSTRSTRRVLMVRNRLLFTNDVRPSRCRGTTILPRTYDVRKASKRRTTVRPRPFLFSNARRVRPLVRLRQMYQLQHRSNANNNGTNGPLILFRAMSNGTIIFRRIFRSLRHLTTSLLQLRRVRLLNRDVSLTGAIPTTRSLTTRRPFVLRHVLVRFPNRFGPLARRIVFFLRRANNLFVARLRVTTKHSRRGVCGRHRPINEHVGRRRRNNALPRVTHYREGEHRRDERRTYVRTMSHTSRRGRRRPRVSRPRLHIHTYGARRRFHNRPHNDSLHGPRRRQTPTSLVRRFTCGTFFLNLPNTPHVVSHQGVVRGTMPLRPTMPTTSDVVYYKMNLSHVNSMRRLRPKLGLLRRLTRLPLYTPGRVQRHGSLQLQYPYVRRPNGRVNRFFYARHRRQLHNLFLRLGHANERLFRRPHGLVHTTNQSHVRMKRTRRLSLGLTNSNMVRTGLLHHVNRRHFTKKQRGYYLQP